jgi:hypothetical protein
MRPPVIRLLLEAEDMMKCSILQVIKIRSAILYLRAACGTDSRDAQYAVLSVRSTQYAVRSILLAGSFTQGQYVRVRCRVLVGPLAPW